MTDRTELGVVRFKTFLDEGDHKVFVKFMISEEINLILVGERACQDSTPHRGAGQRWTIKAVVVTTEMINYPER